MTPVTERRNPIVLGHPAPEEIRVSSTRPN